MPFKMYYAYIYIKILFIRLLYQYVQTHIPFAANNTSFCEELIVQCQYLVLAVHQLNDQYVELSSRDTYTSAVTY